MYLENKGIPGFFWGVCVLSLNLFAVVCRLVLQMFANGIYRLLIHTPDKISHFCFSV